MKEVFVGKMDVLRLAGWLQGVSGVGVVSDSACQRWADLLLILMQPRRMARELVLLLSVIMAASWSLLAFLPC